MEWPSADLVESTARAYYERLAERHYLPPWEEHGPHTRDAWLTDARRSLTVAWPEVDRLTRENAELRKRLYGSDAEVRKWYERAMSTDRENAELRAKIERVEKLITVDPRLGRGFTVAEIRAALSGDAAPEQPPGDHD